MATNLAILANQSGQHARAQQLAEEALLTFRDLGDRQGIATAGVALANAERGLGTQKLRRSTVKHSISSANWITNRVSPPR